MVNLRWFRKHQKIMLVVFGVTLMAVFVIGSVVDVFTSAGRGTSGNNSQRNTQPVVKWSGGTLSHGELQRFAQLHYAAINLQERLIESASQRSSAVPPAMLINPIRDFGSQENVDREIFNRFLWAQYAKNKLGITISDESVLDFWSVLAGGEVGLGIRDLVNFCRSKEIPAGYNQIHEYMKIELAAKRLEEIYAQSFLISGPSGAPPASVLDAWQAFLQSEKQIECAVEEFNISEFKSQITEAPPSAELRKLFNDGKTRDEDPTNEKPGFKRPRKVAIEYVVAEGKTFSDVAIQDVTAEQVVAEYNRLVEAKDPLVMEDVPDPNAPGNPPADGEKLQDEPAPEIKKDAPQSGDPAPAPDAGGDKPPAEPASETPAAPEGDKAPAPNAETPKKPEENPSSGGGAHILAPSNSQFVSLVKSAQDSAGQDEPKPDAPQEEPKADAPKQDPASQQDQPPAPETPTQENPPVPAGQEQPKSEGAANPPAANQNTTQVAEPQKRPKKLDSELELIIKRRMRSGEATKLRDAAIEKARSEMNMYAFRYSDVEADKQLPASQRTGATLPSFELKKLADDNRLKYGKTSLNSYSELQKDPISQAVEFGQNPMTRQLTTRRIPDDVFMGFDRIQLYSVQELSAISDLYIYWVTEKVDSRIPSFEEAQSEVADAWKAQRSLEMAKTAAQKVCDEVKASNGLLAEMHKDKATLTGGFRWFQTMFGNTSYGAPKGVKNAGEDFMKAAFALQPNQLAVAVNDDRSAVYAIQLISGDPRTNEQLRDQFISNIARFKQLMPSSVNEFYNRKSIGKFVDRINEEMKVEWLSY